jgi:hypothetical protein
VTTCKTNKLKKNVNRRRIKDKRWSNILSTAELRAFNGEKAAIFKIRMRKGRRIDHN